MTDDATPTPLRLSFSSMSLFKQCPKRWEFRYIDKLGDPAGYAATLGSFVHQCFEHFFELPAAKRTREAMKAIAREQYDLFITHERYATEFAENVGTEEADHKLFRQKAWISIMSLWEFENPESVKVVHNEYEFLLDVDGIKVKGFIDRLEEKNGKVEIVDYKTGKAPMRRYQADKLEQLYLYGAAVLEDFGEMPSKGKLYFLGSEIVSTPLNKGRVDLIRRNITATAVKINKAKIDGFEPTVGPLCAWCAYVDKCPAGQEEITWRSKEGKIKKAAPGYQLGKELAAAAALEAETYF